MKKMDNLEQFIAHNRASFDSETPSEKVWTHIESRLSDNDTVLEQFIQVNREQFDTETPHLKVWTAIDNRINAGQTGGKLVRMSWLRQAAAAVALLIVGAVLGVWGYDKTQSKELAQVTRDIAPDLKEAENFYNKKVEARYTQLVSHNPDPLVINDLKQLDEVQRELKKELENAPATAREEIVRRLIENYQIKLGILERVLNHIEEHQSDNQKEQQNEKI